MYKSGPLKPLRPAWRPFEERFWAQVDRTGECWVWRGMTDRKGYGFIYRRVGSRLAHRAGYEMQVGPIPAGLLVLHHCDNPPCVRGEHLFTGTAADNSRDMVTKDRAARGERAPNVKLTDAAVLEMRRLHANGARVCELATRFGVSQSATCTAVWGKSWKHLPLTVEGR